MSWTDLTAVEVLDVAGEHGVFALRDIAANHVLGVFDGIAQVFSVSPDGQVDWRGQDGAMSIHVKLLDGRLYAIMPFPDTPPDGIDFINHSCNPNCRCAAGTLVVESIRPIARGEHLTLNYHDMDLIKLGVPCWCEDVAEDKRCIL